MKRVVLAARPDVDPVPGDFRIEDAAIPEPGAGQIVVQTLFLSIDPYVRLTLDEQTLGGPPGLPLGASPVGRAVGRVVASQAEGFAVGDLVEGRTAWAEYAVVDPAAVRPTKLDFGALPLSYAVGALGMPGQTAYAGMIDVGRVKAGETVVISAAAGAVGTIAGQIGKLHGARVVGIAGGPDKCAAVIAAGFDACVDYKAADFDAQLKAALPDGFQLYFENVGGALTPRVLAHAAYGVRVALCGVIAVYAKREESGPDMLPELMRLLFVKGAQVQSFFGELVGGAHALAANREWIEQGRLKPVETILDGIEAVPAAFAGTFRGNAHVGKVLVRIAD